MKLGEQPFRILQYLAARPGVIVTREELQKLLWGEGTFVDSEHGLNAAINKLREALSDSAATPRYIETVPRRGYRFVGEVANPIAPIPAEVVVDLPVEPTPTPIERRKSYLWWLAGAAVLLVIGMGAGAWLGRSKSAAGTQFRMRPLTADAGLTTQPAISRDGKLVVYASDRATSKNLDIWVHPLAQGAQPIRLTHHEADERFPDISPDGGLVAFRSERDGGGIYVVPALGGEERLLVRGGEFPRFSPDGKTLAYCVGTSYETLSEIYTIAINGGTPRRLAADVPWACSPFFSADGRHIVFEGGSGANDWQHDWWVTPAAGGASVKTGAFEILRTQMNARWIIPSIPDLSDGRLLFALSGQIWELDLPETDWKARGPARPLTSGSVHQGVRAGTGSRMVFVNTQATSHLWKLDVDHKKGKVLGEMQPLPHAGGAQQAPSASADGSLLAYTQFDPTGGSIRLRSLDSGKERTVAVAGGRSHVSPDGTRLAYSFRDGMYVMASTGWEAKRLISLEQKLNMSAFGWTPDGKKIVYWHGTPIRFALLDPETGQSTEFLAHSKYTIHGARISPDQKWVAFNTQDGKTSPLWIAAYRNEKAAEEKDWIRVSGDLGLRPWWSPDGNLLYVVSQRDGQRCIWVQPLDGVNKRPKGEAFALLHAHGARVKIPSALRAFGPAVLPGGLIFGMDEESGNVWLAEPRVE